VWGEDSLPLIKYESAITQLWIRAERKDKRLSSLNMNKKYSSDITVGEISPGLFYQLLLYNLTLYTNTNP